MFIQILVHFCRLVWLSILHPQTTLPASILIAASVDLGGECSKTLFWLAPSMGSVSRWLEWQWTAHLVHRDHPGSTAGVAKPFPKTCFLDSVTGPLSFCYGHDFLFAGLTFPLGGSLRLLLLLCPVKASGIFQPNIWSVHCMLHSQVISELNNACRSQNLTLSSPVASLKWLLFPQRAVKNFLLYDFPQEWISMLFFP